MLLLRRQARPQHRVRIPLLWIREKLRHIDVEASNAPDPAYWLRRASALARCADPDPDHGRRVARLVETVAIALGTSRELAGHLRHAAELHDIGKYALPRSLLTHPGALTPEQRRLLVLHTHAANWLLEGLAHPVFVLARVMGHGHHERWDGDGYPSGAALTGIPMEARLVAACDVWDALTHPRPYRAAYCAAQAGALFSEMAGTALDPDIASTLLDLLRCQPEYIYGT